MRTREIASIGIAIIAELVGVAGSAEAQKLPLGVKSNGASSSSHFLHCLAKESALESDLFLNASQLVF